MAEGMTVGDVCRTLLFEIPVDFDGSPTRNAVLQLTLDGDKFYAIDTFIDYGDGGVVAQLAPWPPEHEENWADPEWRRKMHDDLLASIVPTSPSMRCSVHGVTFMGEDDRCHWGVDGPGDCSYALVLNR